jgi:hypothetical protein
VVARCTARAGTPSTNRLHRSRVAPQFANDSLCLREGDMRREYLTEARVAALGEELTARDREIVETLDLLRLASGEQLARLHFPNGERSTNPRKARRTLRRLTDVRVLTRLDRSVGGERAGSAGFIYALDVAGQRLASASGPAGGKRTRRPWTPGAAFVSHQLAVTELFVRLTEHCRRDKAQLLDFWAEPLCWRRFAGLGGARVTLKPDAFVRVGVTSYEHLSFVEVDRSTQSVPAIARKLVVYRRYFQTGREQERFGVFPRVVFLVPSAERKEALVDLLGKQPAEYWPLFAVARYDDAVGALTGGTP